MRDVRPDLAIGTTPIVQRAKEAGIPAIYFTNMVSARPLFSAAGIAALTGIVRTQTAGRERFGRMRAFFEPSMVHASAGRTEPADETVAAPPRALAPAGLEDAVGV